ncbi:hypothetical protein KC19_10G128400 [Ceratodon purpureus]|uniref:RING-CH-type domain-containing protein n=1 Tax=Ceratodon purpureus TaxID=3225 RepID=A0A8T0GMH5_CERPU|nr:hypothetical protein KC19_10G128400 [Ceratodon purpureus]
MEKTMSIGIEEATPSTTTLEALVAMDVIERQPLIMNRGDIDLEIGPEEDQRQCRICLELDGEDFIAPCKCRGSQKYVHRECLDNWRSIKEGFAFCHCTTCKTPYHIRVHTPADRKWRKLKFHFFVTLDILAIFFAVQLVVCLFGYLVYIIDHRMKNELEHFWGFERDYPFYYFCGVIVFLVFLGLSGCFITCYNWRLQNESAQSYREFCIYCCRGMCRDCHISRTLCMWTDCAMCCEGCSGSLGECTASFAGAGEATPMLMIVGLVTLAIFAIMGIFYSVIVAAMVFQRIWQRHYHILSKRMLTKEYVVEDLDGEILGPDWTPPSLAENHVQQLELLELL